MAITNTVSTPHRSVVRTITVLLASVAMIFGFISVISGSVAGAATPTTAIATLGTNPTYATQESTGGVKVAMMELNWSSYEPQQGVFNLTYEKQMQTVRLAQGGRDAGHPRPGPAFHSGLGEEPAKRDLRRPGRWGVHRGQHGFQQQCPQTGRELPGPREFGAAVRQFLGGQGDLRRQERGAVPAERQVLGLRRQRAERSGHARHDGPQSVPRLAARHRRADHHPGQPVGELVRRSAGRHRTLAGKRWSVATVSAATSRWSPPASGC